MNEVPEGFEEAFICEALNITWTELMKQPVDWVEKMMVIKNQRSKIEEIELKKQRSALTVKKLGGVRRV